MATEIEHKFLVHDESWRDQVERSDPIAQAYLASESRVTVRARISGERAWLTLKGASTGLAQLEFEYPIPVADAREIIASLSDSAVIDKTRHTLRHGSHEWVVDEFHGDNAGLIVAEIELESENEAFEIPSWAGTRVTFDRRYRNKFLAHHPFSSW